MANSAGEFCHHWKSWTKSDYLKIKGKHCEIWYQWISAGATDKEEESALTTVCCSRCGCCVFRDGSKRIASRGRFVILVALQGEGWNAHIKVGAVCPLDAKSPPVHNGAKNRHLRLIPLSLHSVKVLHDLWPVNCQTACLPDSIWPELLCSSAKNKTKRQSGEVTQVMIKWPRFNSQTPHCKSVSLWIKAATKDQSTTLLLHSKCAP